ncbi:MAG: response regulator [Deltaproteobacteria bacterium]|nr:response regulator [Deltaproteobacteria bacterium]
MSQDAQARPGRRVLIVEDSAAMRQLLAFAVKRVPSVIIDEAPDGVAALKALKAAQNTPYDLVLLDLNMPIMDGLKLLGRMREDPTYAHTTVCVVTTEESFETEKQALLLGAKYFIRKPVNRRTVEKILAEVFGQDP